VTVSCAAECYPEYWLGSRDAITLTCENIQRSHVVQ